MSVIDSQVPLIDLHRHLDGNVRIETVIELGKKHKLPLPAWSVEGMKPYIQVSGPQPGVMAFIEKFYWLTQVLVDYDACRRIAYENVEDAMREGLDYVELRFSPRFMAEPHGLEPAKVVEAVCAGTAEGQRDFKTRANLIGIISRTYGVEAGFSELEALLQFRDQIKALDLAGDEAKYPARLFKRHFDLAQNAGWKITVHAGESAGPESIREALNELGASRIGHAISAVRDDQLMAELRERRIGIECNLTSNVQTSSVESYARHPIRQFVEHGLLATINSDDPAISAIDLRYEYEVAAPAAGLSLDQIRTVQRNALEVAFLSEEEKVALTRKKLHPAG